MRKEEFYVLNSLYNGSIGRAGCTYDVEATKALNDTDIYNKLVKTGYIEKESGSITKTGLEALEPYRVNNAVILAAGASTRFIPLSLEQPKGLFEVKGERLIERQIKQLQDAGIKNITVVLGYKKEMFYYLEDKYGVKFIINDSFNIKNNIESLYLARKELKNTYICVSDSYYIENPFNQFEYHTFYSGYYGKETHRLARRRKAVLRVKKNQLVRVMISLRIKQIFLQDLQCKYQKDIAKLEAREKYYLTHQIKQIYIYQTY